MTSKLKAETRKVTGRKVKALRNEGKLPANVYGKGYKSLAVTLDTKDFSKAYSEVGETGILNLTVDKKELPVLIHNVQVDPLDDTPIHADLLKVDLKQKISATVPVELVGESPAEKGGLGTVVLQLNEIGVEALPTDLPKQFEIDIAGLDEVDKAVYVRDLVYDKKKVEVKQDADQIVVKVEPPQKEEEITPPPTVGEGAEAEVTPEEGEGEKAEETSQAPQEKSES